MFDVESLGLYCRAGVPVAIDTFPSMEPLLLKTIVESLTSFDIIVWDCCNRARSVTVENKVMVYGEPCEKKGAPFPHFVEYAREVLKPPTEVGRRVPPTRKLIVVKDVLEDLLTAYPQPELTTWKRAIKELLYQVKQTQNRLVFFHNNLTIPEEYKDLLVEMDNPLPNEEEVTQIVRLTINSLRASARAQGKEFSVSEDLERDKLVRALMGLTPTGVEDILNVVGVKYKGFNKESLPTVLEIKKQALAKRGLTFAEPPDVDIQGLSRLIDWAKTNACLLDRPARERHNLTRPSNVLLIGPPGTGKSLAVKATSQTWGIPCIQFDIGSLMTSALGGSEANLRAILKQAEAMQPCILWIDEMDKQLSPRKMGDNDGGTSSRMLGTLLSWLEETQADVIVVATANRPDGFTPEMLRRFKCFFVDLPDTETLRNIWQVQLAAFKLQVSSANLRLLASESEGMTGAEIRSIVKESATEAFAAGHPEEVSWEDLMKKVRVKPRQANSIKSEILEVKQWAASGAAEPAGG